MPSFPCGCAACICHDQYDCYNNHCACCVDTMSGHRYMMGKTKGDWGHRGYSSIYYAREKKGLKLGGPLDMVASKCGRCGHRARLHAGMVGNVCRLKRCPCRGYLNTNAAPRETKVVGTLNSAFRSMSGS